MSLYHQLLLSSSYLRLLSPLNSLNATLKHYKMAWCNRLQSQTGPLLFDRNMFPLCLGESHCCRSVFLCISAWSAAQTPKRQTVCVQYVPTFHSSRLKYVPLVSDQIRSARTLKLDIHKCSFCPLLFFCQCMMIPVRSWHSIRLQVWLVEILALLAVISLFKSGVITSTLNNDKNVQE